MNTAIANALGLGKTGSGTEFTALYPTAADLKAKLEPTVNPSSGVNGADDTGSINGTSGSSATLSEDKKDWKERIDKLANTYGEYPTSQSEPISINDLITKMGNMPVTKSDIHDGTDDGIAWDSANQNNNVFNADERAGDERKDNTSIKDINKYSFAELINPKGGKDITMIIADDGDNKDVPKEQAKSNFMFLTNKILGAMAKALSVPATALQAITKNYTDTVCNNIDNKKYNAPGSGKNDKQYQLGRDNCLKGNLISGGVDTTGTDRDAFMLNVSELCRELIAMVIDSYSNTNSTNGGLALDNFGYLKNTSKVSLDTSTQHTLTYNSKGYSESAYTTLAAEEFKSAGYKVLNWPEALKILRNITDTSNDSETDETTGPDGVNPPNNVGQGAVGEYYQTLWSKLAQSGWYVDSNIADLQSKLENGQYYLNGTTVKNNKDFYEEEQEVSAEQTAKAEAFWKVEMQKINRKEKKHDTDMNTLQTEYSSLTTDYESVNSIIQKNISRSFTFCQNG